MAAKQKPILYNGMGQPYLALFDFRRYADNRIPLLVYLLELILVPGIIGMMKKKKILLQLHLILEIPILWT